VAALSPPQGRPCSDIIPDQIRQPAGVPPDRQFRVAINKCPHDIVPACAHRPAPIRTQKLASGKSQERESSESPMLNAFCRGRALGSFQLPGDLRRGGFLLRHRLQFTNFGRRPSAPLL